MIVINVAHYLRTYGNRESIYKRYREDISALLENTYTSVDSVHELCELATEWLSTMNVLNDVGGALDALPENMKALLMRRYIYGSTLSCILSDYENVYEHDVALDMIMDAQYFFMREYERVVARRQLSKDEADDLEKRRSTPNIVPLHRQTLWWGKRV